MVCDLGWGCTIFFGSGTFQVRGSTLQSSVSKPVPCLLYPFDMSASDFSRGNEFLRNGQLEEAIAAYQKAIGQNRDFYLAYQNLGEALEKLGRFDEAIAAYRRAVELKPEAAWSYVNLSRVLRQVGRVDEAEKAEEQAVGIDPKLADFSQNGYGIKENISTAVNPTEWQGKRPRVGVCGWELSHNAAGRVYTLAQLYQTFADVEIIGSIFPQWGREVWEPIRQTKIPCHHFFVKDESQFIDEAIKLVRSHPYDIVHLSKPRLPNILFGLLYKSLWNSRVIVDIDDEEMAFVGAESSIELDDYLKKQGRLPDLKELTGTEWTRIAVGLVREFDGVTVSNPALQERYGGVVIRHGRDEGRFVPSADLKRRSRERFGIAQDKKVVLFFGTPRKHKGLVTTARALGSLGRKDVVFAIIGDFPDGKLKEELQGIPGVDYVFVGNQPFESIPDVVAVGDVCVLLQDVGSEVSQFQIPAKLSDALGMGLVVLLSETAAVADVIESGAVVPVAEGDLPAVLGRVLSDEAECNKFRVRGRELLAAEFGFGVNGSRLAEVMDGVRGGVGVLSDELNLLLAGFPAVGSVWSGLRDDNKSRFGWDDRKNLEDYKTENDKNKVDIVKADDGLDIYLANPQKGAFFFPYKPKESQYQRFVGNLDKFDKNELTGWLIDKLNPGKPCYLHVFINNIFYRQVLTDRQRHDLQKALGYSGFGFLIEIPYIPKGNQNVEIKATPIENKSLIIGKGVEDKPIVIQKFKSSLGWSVNRLLATQLHFPIRNESIIGRSTNKVAIIVPVFNAYNEVCQCLKSIVKNTRTPAQLILINDGSTDKRLIYKLEQFSQTIANVVLYSNEINLGYTASVNKGIEMADGADVVLLNSDTIVTASWLRNLQMAAYSAVDIATVTPLSNNAGAFSVPEDQVNNPIPSWIDQQSFARLVTQESLALYPEVPTGNGFCLYIRRDALDDIGLFDEKAFSRGYGEENDFCFRALTRGWRNIIDDRTIIYHVRSASFGEQKSQLAESGRKVIDKRYPEYAKAVRNSFTDSSVMATLRFNLRQNLHHYPRFCLPRVLYVIHSESGGTPQTTVDLMMEVGEEWEPFLLLSDTKCIKLYDYRGQQKTLVEEFYFKEKITISIHDSTDYRHFIEHILIRYGIELLHIRHIGRHGLSLTPIAKKLGIPILFSFHDYYTITPNVKLLDYREQYCLDQWSQEEARKNVELWGTNTSPRLDQNWRRRWQNRMSEMLSFCDGFVTTSHQAKDIIQSVFPFMKDRDFRVIPHGRNFSQMLSLGRVPSPTERIRILVPGNLCTSKGSVVIRKIKACDHKNRIEFHFLGNPDTSLDDIGIQHGSYERECFWEIAAKIKPHLGAVLSIWPETYCHTLTELWAAGLPVIGFSVGAVGERLQQHGGGWILDNSDPNQIYHDITHIYTSPDKYREKLDQVLAWQRGYGSIYGTQAMSYQYLKLYRSLQEKQLNFVATQENDKPTKSQKNRQIIEVLYSQDDCAVPHHRKALKKWLSENYADSEFTWKRFSYHELLEGKNDSTIGSDDLVVLSIYELSHTEADRFLIKASEANLNIISLLEEYKTLDKDASRSLDSTTLIRYYEPILKFSQAILAIGTKSWVESLSQHLGQDQLIVWTYSVLTDNSWHNLVKLLVVQGNDRIDWLQTMKKGQSRKKDHVSIIIPVYGKQNLTRQCLDSIFSLTSSSFLYDVLVVDNGSPDDTASMVRKMQTVYPNLQLIRSRENLMFSSGCNLGIVASKSEYVVLLNNDTVVSDKWLDYLIEPLRQDITIGLTGPKLIYSNNTLQAGGIVFGNQSKFPYHIYKGMPADCNAVNKSRCFQALTGACVAVRALDIIAVEGLDPVFVNGSEDIDLCFKIRKKLNKKLLYCPNSKIIHHEGKTPGRGRYRLHNRKVFVDKWRDSIEVDDFLFYQKDGFYLDGYSTDEGDLIDSELASINAKLSRNIQES
ncbi:glycosyltransferase [Limnospira sp. PMC 1306.21]|uniref:glycosyltransferase n=1 Tax=Limnospira sp. PMC 1306.21 TaxID=2981089 RepID=UPI0028EA40A8|nr:glycosyltransferase [Limnospira sp. PMC 1306.21]